MVGRAGGHQAQHLQLAPGQPAGRAGGPGQPVEAVQVGAGPEPGQHRPGGVQLHGGGVLVAQLPAGQADEQPGPGRLVGRLQLAPGPPGAAQGGHGPGGVAVGQADRPSGVVGRREQGQGPVAVGDPGQLGRGLAGGAEVAGGEQDLHGGREQPGPLQPVAGLAEHAADRRRGGLGPPLGQPEQGQPGLRLPAPAARQLVGLLGRLELAEDPVGLGLLVAGRPDGQLVGRPRPAARRPAGPPRPPPARPRPAAGSRPGGPGTGR